MKQNKTNIGTTQTNKCLCQLNYTFSGATSVNQNTRKNPLFCNSYERHTYNWWINTFKRMLCVIQRHVNRWGCCCYAICYQNEVGVSIGACNESLNLKQQIYQLNATKKRQSIFTVNYVNALKKKTSLVCTQWHLILSHYHFWFNEYIWCSKTNVFRFDVIQNVS